MSGPIAGSIVNTASAATSVSGLVEGVYKFTLTVTDNAGATNTDTMQVTVNTAPVANAGVDQSITLPANTVNLGGSGVDIGRNYCYLQMVRSIRSLQQQTITNASLAGTSVTGLTAGVYKFILTVTDNDGGVGRDSILVTVNPAIITNKPPTAHAGADISVKLPANKCNIKW